MPHDLNGKRVVLIDGSGYVFRAFYALPPMTRADGTPVNAVYGFCTMMMKLLKETPADYLAVVFDAARKTFRQDIFPEYKANRREVPPELIPQFPLLREAVGAFNIAAVELEGYEADDLLATYARLAEKAGAAVTVVSADKDLMQLVRPNVTLFDPMKHRVVDVPQVVEKFGVPPDKVVDVQSLAGDPTDNVPGVSGIGVKTAALLINEFGSLDALLARAGEIKQPKRRETLLAEKERAEISRKLVTLNDKSPVTVPLDDFAVRPVDEEKLAAFFTAQSFKSLSGKRPAPQTARPQTPEIAGFPAKTPSLPERRPSETAVTVVEAVDELKEVLKRAKTAGTLAIHAETNDFSETTSTPAGIAFSFEEGRAFYVPVGADEGTVQADLFAPAPSSQKAGLPPAAVASVFAGVFGDPEILKVAHDVKRMAHLMSNLSGKNVFPAPCDDTAVMVYASDGTSQSRDLIAAAALTGVDIPLPETVLGKGQKKTGFDDLPVETAARWAGKKADAVLRLHHFLKQRLIFEKNVTVYECFDRPLIPVLFDMERAGIRVDTAELKRLSAFFGARIAELEQKIHAEAGEEFNINSPAQLAVVLFDKLGLESADKTAKTKARSTDAAVLQELADNGSVIADLVLQWRRFAKLKSTYADALPVQADKKTCRIHTEFLQTNTSTGRLASNAPNLQNIPVRTEEGRAIRKAFVAPDGFVLLSADYSQVELRLMAHLADVKALKQAFADGADIHAATASHMFGVPVDGMDPMIRRRAKAINFGIIYGISAFGLANQLGISRSEAKEYIDAYFARYPEIKAYMNDTIAFARKHGYVETPFGRKCFTENILDKNAARRAFAERAAVNAPVQGGAADILKKAMIRLPDVLKNQGLSARLLLQVHDELILEVPEDQIEETERIVKDVMENTTVLSVPLTVDTGTGKNWQEAH